MMRDPELIDDEAMDAEERELLRRIGDAPALIGWYRAVCGRRRSWTNLPLVIAHAFLFAGLWAAGQFFLADEPAVQLRWGLPAAVLLIVATVLKMALQELMESNQLVRELKRIELQLARTSKFR